jgi:hypothetical protein
MIITGMVMGVEGGCGERGSPNGGEGAKRPSTSQHKVVSHSTQHLGALLAKIQHSATNTIHSINTMKIDLTVRTLDKKLKLKNLKSTK